MQLLQTWANKLRTIPRIEVEDPHPSRLTLRKGGKYIALDWENNHWHFFKVDGCDIDSRIMSDKEITEAFINELHEWLSV